MNTLEGEANVSIFLSFSVGSQPLEEITCYLHGKGRALLAYRSKKKATNVVSLCKMAEKHGGVPFYLNVQLYMINMKMSNGTTISLCL